MRLIEFWIYLPKHVPIIQFITVGAVQQMGALHGHCEFDVQPKIYNILHLTIIHVKYVCSYNITFLSSSSDCLPNTQSILSSKNINKKQAKRIGLNFILHILITPSLIKFLRSAIIKNMLKHCKFDIFTRKILNAN